MPEDYLYNHTDLLAKYFGADVITSDQYCAGTRSYDWQSGKPRECEPGQHEAMLAEFLTNDPAGKSKAGLDVLVLVGGIGTGKTTTVREMVRQIKSQKRVCSAADENHCSDTPIIIDLDFSEIYDDANRRGSDKARARVQMDDLWNITATRLERILAGKLTFDDESGFWAWALNQEAIRDRSLYLHRWLNDADLQIRALITKTPYSGWTLDDIAHSLERQRSELMTHIPAKDLVWYRVFQLIYAVQELRKFRCRCRYIFLDNVDHLEPDVQADVVDFVILLSDVLRARTLIAIRPLTWERSVNAHMLVRTENHYSPSLREVLLRRHRALAGDQRVPRDLVAFVRAIVMTFTGGDGLWSQMFEATSGLSIRFAIRNFLNLTQSKLLPEIAYGDPIARMRASDVGKAFFFGDGENILHNNLENLYGLGTDMRLEYRLIKARILDYMIRICDGITTLDDLQNIMAKVNYAAPIMLKALNDMLWRSRPLLWCQAGHQISSVTGRWKVSVTPIGRGYHDKLFGQLYYDEVCLAKATRDVVTLDRVLEFHKQIWQQDRKEITKVIRKHGAGFYLSLYPRETPAISALHAAKLKEGVERRELTLPANYDAERVEFIRSEVEKLVGPRW